jgi:hypothetical protein
MVSKIIKYLSFASMLAKEWKNYKPLLCNMEAIRDGVKYGDSFSNKSPDTSLRKSSLETNPLYEYFQKNTVGNGIWKWHQYFEMYHKHLKKFVGRSPVLVEVGVYSGGSLPMWSSYLGCGTKIHGIDIEPACMSYQNDTTTIHIGDQEDRGFWNEFLSKVPSFDIFIDDGGHMPNQQQTTLEEVLPRINPGGIYICEDIHSEHNSFHWFISGMLCNMNHNSPFFSKTGEPASHIGNLQKWVKSISFYPYAVVIEKNNEPVLQLDSPRRGTIWQPFLDHCLKK